MPRDRSSYGKHWAEKARVWMWYWKIRHLSGWSDYKLDCEFAWIQKRKDSTADERPRTFEWIRKTTREPAGRLKMAKLVADVDQHPWFKGTKALYEAELWKLFQEASVTPQVLQNRIDKLLKTHGLVRVHFNDLSCQREQLIGKHSLASIYDRCLSLSMREMERWNKIELVWCLFIQNEPPHNGDIRSTLASIADSQLDKFFIEWLPTSLGLGFYQKAVSALLGSRLDLSSMDGSYGYIEAEGRMPVIPAELVGKIEESHLYGWLSSI